MDEAGSEDLEAEGIDGFLKYLLSIIQEKHYVEEHIILMKPSCFTKHWQY